MRAQYEHDYLVFSHFYEIQQTYRSQYLPDPTSTCLEEAEQEKLEDEWYTIISDTFKEIHEKVLQCADCAESHYQEETDGRLESIRSDMEITEVLMISENDFDTWNEQIQKASEAYWKEFAADGGCPRDRPQPGTLVNGTLVLDRWEQKCYEEWMEGLYGPGWRHWEQQISSDEGAVVKEHDLSNYHVTHTNSFTTETTIASSLAKSNEKVS